MVIGGSGANNDVEVFDMEDFDAAVCPKPKNIPLGFGSVATFINGAVLACGTHGSADCYFYDHINGRDPLKCRVMNS